MQFAFPIAELAYNQYCTLTHAQIILTTGYPLNHKMSDRMQPEEAIHAYDESEKIFCFDLAFRIGSFWHQILRHATRSLVHLFIFDSLLI